MRTQIHFLPTGASDCIILESDGHFAMIDAGEDTDFPPEKPWLKTKGYEAEICRYLCTHCAAPDGEVYLDFILGTHSHSDHIGGFDTVIRHPKIHIQKAYLKPYHAEQVTAFEVERWDNQEVYDQMAAALAERRIPLISSFDGETLRLGAFQIRFFNGSYQRLKCRMGENVHSVVTHVQAYGLRALLMGDMNVQNGGERAIARQVGKVDLLKIGHHGYPQSTSAGLLRATHPLVAILPNKQHYAAPWVLWKIRHIAKARLYATENTGGICAEFHPNGMLEIHTGIGSAAFFGAENAPAEKR